VWKALSSHYAYNNVVLHYKKAKRTNSTFGFCQHRSQNKKPKELFFANAQNKLK